jgi:hypothetical protein
VDKKLGLAILGIAFISGACGEEFTAKQEALKNEPNAGEAGETGAAGNSVGGSSSGGGSGSSSSRGGRAGSSSSGGAPSGGVGSSSGLGGSSSSGTPGEGGEGAGELGGTGGLGATGGTGGAGGSAGSSGACSENCDDVCRGFGFGSCNEARVSGPACECQVDACNPCDSSTCPGGMQCASIGQRFCDAPEGCAGVLCAPPGSIADQESCRDRRGECAAGLFCMNGGSWYCTVEPFCP